MSEAQRRVLFGALVALSLALLAVVALIGPADIVAFQLDGSPEAAAERVLRWSARGELDGAIASHRWDYALLAVYGITVGWSVLKARRQMDALARDVGAVLAIGAAVAAALDAVENTALLRFIDLVELPSASAPPDSNLPRLAASAATLKWALLGAAGAYIALGATAWRRARRMTHGPAIDAVAAGAGWDGEPAAPRPAPRPEDWVGAELDGDLIMKGGITSGVIYPRLATRLATRYRFHSIGGTSAGAIAAAATAAAEYARQRGRLDGFQRLQRLPDQLGSGLLLQLFKPTAGTRPLLELFLRTTTAGPSGRDRLDAALRTLVRFHPWLALVATGLGAAIGLALVAPLTIPDGAWLGFALATLTVLVLLSSLVAGAVAAGQRVLVALALHLATGLEAPGDPLEAAVIGIYAAFVALGVHASRSGRLGPVSSLSVFVLRGSSALALAVSAVLLGTLHLVAYGAAFGMRPLTVALVTALLATAATSGGALLRANRALTANGAGIVNGVGGVGDGPGVTEWLTDLLDDVAFGDEAERDRRDRDGRPLTFRDLYGAPDRRADEPHRITLEVMGTALSTATAHRLPFRPDETFAWREDDLAPLLPPRVVDALRGASEEADGAPGVLRLTDNLDLPVVVAVRISMSFPVLFAPVPLQVELPAGWSRTYWGDGGAASNLPVHFFDSLIPRWPTFAVDLRQVGQYTDYGVDPDTAGPDDLVVVSRERPTRPLWLSRAGTTRPLTVPDVIAGFLGAATDWRDNVQSQADGHWDRVVHVLQRDGEGGMNLAMDADTIASLAERGDAAATALIGRFDPGVGADGWDHHRWDRYRLVMAELEEAFDDVSDRLATGYHALLSEPPAGSGGWLPRQGKPAREATDDLEAWARRWLRRRLFTRFANGDEPHARSVLRVTPRT